MAISIDERRSSPNHLTYLIPTLTLPSIDRMSGILFWRQETDEGSGERR